MPLWYREAVSLYWRFPSLVWEQWSQAADISKVSAEWRTLILSVISPLPWGGTVQRNTAGGYRLMQLKHLLHFFFIIAPFSAHVELSGTNQRNTRIKWKMVSRIFWMSFSSELRLCSLFADYCELQQATKLNVCVCDNDILADTDKLIISMSWLINDNL